MAYNEEAAQRIRAALHRIGRRPGEEIAEKRMFGGLTFMVAGKMCCGVLKDDIVMRLLPDDYDAALSEPHVRPMDFTGKPMPGFAYVAPPGYATGKKLDDWMARGLNFVRSNAAGTRPKAKARTKMTVAKKQPVAKKAASVKEPAAAKKAVMVKEPAAAK